MPKCYLLLHTRVPKCISSLVCSVDFLPVCKKEHYKCVYKREREHVHVCGRLSPTEAHPTLVKAQRRVTQVSNGNSTQTHTHTEQDA